MGKYTRRDFVKTAGMGAAGGLMMSSMLKAQTAGASQPSKSVGANDRLNIAIVGLGAQGQVLLDSLVKIPGIQFRAVCDIWEARRRYGRGRILGNVKQDLRNNLYENYEDLIEKEKDLDGVFIATPDFWHAPHTNAFLKAGVNVYCEKMMSNTVEGARSMVRTARETGKLLQIGHQRTSNPRYHYMHDVLMRKLQLCGRITNANGQWNRAVTKDLEVPSNQPISKEVLEKYGFEGDPQKFRNWRWYKGMGAGPISDLGAHQIDVFAWMFGGRPTSVIADGSNDFYGKDWYDNVMCIFDYNTFQGHKAKAFYQVLTTTSAGGGYYEMFMGPEGAVKISENPKLTRMFVENEPKKLKEEIWSGYLRDRYLRQWKTPAPPADPEDEDGDSRESPVLEEYKLPVKLGEPIHMPHIKNFFNAIRGTEKLNCDAEHAFEAEAPVFKVNEAIAAGKKLYFKDEDFIA